MIIRAYWPDCRMLNSTWGKRKIDAFFVECPTQEELDEKVLPYVPPDQIEKLKHWIEGYRDYNQGGRGGMRFGRKIAYLLIARDLSSFSAHKSTYPMANMWGAYSPFVEIEPIEIDSIEELRDVQVKIVQKLGIVD